MTDPGPHRLGATPYVLAPSGQATPRDRTPDFFETLDRDFGDFAGHVLVMTFEFDEPWDTWEIHPKGDEFVYLLSGATDMLLRREDGSTETLRVDQPGSYVVVPQNTWHTARPLEPTAMLFVTPGEGTENLPEPPY